MPVSRRVAAALATLAFATAADAATYRIDPTHTYAIAEVDHFGTSTLRIRFAPIDGDVEFDAAAKRGRVGLRIATSKFASGVPTLDKRLAEADLLDVAGAPEAFYVAERFVFDGDRLTEVRGEFTLRGSSQPLALRALRFNCYPHPLFHREVCGGDFEGELKRSAFGATYGLPLIGDRVRLVVTIEAVKQ
jgi:polyisoprenoid-binding protein YceI